MSDARSRGKLNRNEGANLRSGTGRVLLRDGGFLYASAWKLRVNASAGPSSSATSGVFPRGDTGYSAMTAGKCFYEGSCQEFGRAESVYRSRRGEWDPMTGRYDISAELAERLVRSNENGDAVDGILFHSTVEPIVGRLHGDAFDILWTAKDPYVSSQYIPNAGSERICWRPSTWEMDERVKPGSDSVFYEFACMLTQATCDDITLGRDGRPSSWRYPRSWISYREVVEYLENELGYQCNENGVYSLRQRFDGEAFQTMPADWQVEGRVFMTLSDGLRFLDVRRSSEPDLTEKEYYDAEAFEMAEREGWYGRYGSDVPGV